MKTYRITGINHLKGGSIWFDPKYFWLQDLISVCGPDDGNHAIDLSGHRWKKDVSRQEFLAILTAPFLILQIAPTHQNQFF